MYTEDPIKVLLQKNEYRDWMIKTASFFHRGHLMLSISTHSLLLGHSLLECSYLQWIVRIIGWDGIVRLTIFCVVALNGLQVHRTRDLFVCMADAKSRQWRLPMSPCLIQRTCVPDGVRSLPLRLPCWLSAKAFLKIADVFDGDVGQQKEVTKDAVEVLKAMQCLGEKKFGT